MIWSVWKKVKREDTHKKKKQKKKQVLRKDVAEPSKPQKRPTSNFSPQH